MKHTLRIGLTALIIALPTLASAQYNSNITRADFIVNMMASKGLYGNGGYCFPDVTNQTFAPAVCEAKARGYVRGYGDGKFHPYQSVTLVDAAVFAMRAEGISLPGDSIWYRPAIEKLAEWDAIPDSLNSIAVPLTVSQANEVLIAVRNRGDDDDDDDNDEEDAEHDDDNDDLTVSITENDQRVEEGDIVEYRIRIQNDDNDDVDLDMTAELDEDMSFVSATNGGDHDGDEVEWNDIEIDDDDDIVLTLRVRIRSGADDEVKLRVEADDEVDEEITDIRNSDDDDDDDDNDNDGDIEITVEDSDDPVEAGSTVTYRIRIENNGNDDENVDIEAELDDEMIFVSVTEDGERDGDIVEWDDIRVDEDETETVLLTVRMDSGLDDNDSVVLRVRGGGETETETTRIDDDDDNDDDNDDDVDVSITEVSDPVEENEVITYRITITNNENSRISTDVVAFLDDETSFTSASNGGDERGNDEVEWNNIEIDRDRSVTLLLSVRPLSSVDDGDSVELRVEAGDDEDREETRVDDDDDDDDSDNEDIRLSITDSPDPAEPGDTVSYRINVENLDNDDATIDVRARLDGDMTYISANEGGEISGSEVRWDNVRVDGDDDITLILNVRVRTSADDGDTIRLDVEAEGEEESESTRIED